MSLSSVPPPRSGSPGPSSRSRGNSDDSKSSPATASSSRRPSQSSAHSHSIPHSQASHQLSPKSPARSTHLPRITTSMMDDSAPLPLNSAFNGNHASYSESAPATATGWMKSTRSESPSSSPTDRRAPPTLGPPTPRGPSPAAGLPSSSLPPRQSSRESSRDLASRPSQHSLSDAAGQSQASHTGSAVSPIAFPVPQTRRKGEPTYCGQCGQVVHGQFVRAMGQVYHLNCFRCRDCNDVVAQKFFPVEEGETMYPLCERDYFARLDLICAKCGQALRSSYITACGEKYHVEHFTCSECDTLFGANDSYYEHGGKVYCHFHYSTKFAVKCVGCETAILKQFVEMNRNGRDECWHPECYMISKFWNVRLASKNFNTPANSAVNSTVSLNEMTPSMSAITPAAVTLSPAELKEKQEAMEVKVQQIWHVLSGYEESSAALIGEMLRAVNSRGLLEIILLAEKFILHVEVLFAVIDDLEAQFAIASGKGMSHAREAKQLCRKLVNLFSMMSQINPNGDSPLDSSELFTLITQLAHYLKILIRIALTGSIKLERDHQNSVGMTNSLARLNLLAMDNSDPLVKKRGDHSDSEPSLKPIQTSAEHASTGADEEQLRKSIDALTRHPQGFIPSTQNIAYGYRSLAREVTGETTLRGPHDEAFVPPEGCAHCQLAMEEDCIRYGMFNRWHSACVACINCGDRALVPYEEEEAPPQAPSEEGSIPIRAVRRPLPRVDDFSLYPHDTGVIFCLNHRDNKSVNGFESVSRLEQYAFLLHIALRRLYIHFRSHHDLPSVLGRSIEDTPEVKRVKSVTLDRKLSSTARLPQRSMVVESPAGRMADENGLIVSARSTGALSIVTAPDIRIDGDDDGHPASTVDVIRPPFARNNTSVLIVSENHYSDEAENLLATTTIAQEDDAITLGDIPHLADQAIRERSAHDARPLLAELNPLQTLILRHFALLQLQKTGIGHSIELDEVLELLDGRKNQWWNKIFKGNAKKDAKKKGIFGVPLEVLVEKTGSDTQQGASHAQLRVPEIIEDIISTMRQMDMAIEGIFRKNGNIRKLQTLAEALDKDTTAVVLSEENPVQLAALLKRFLREMPDPLLTFRLHKLFCAAASLQNAEERQRCLHLLVVMLPKCNRDTMEVLFVFLKWVASFSYRDEETGSRMDMANLATVICPSILYAKGSNAARDESFIAIQAVQELLENQDEFYHVPHELAFVIYENIFSLFAKELDLPPKEIHRHCTKYMQARGQPPPPSSRDPRIPGSASANQVRDRDRQNPNSANADPRISIHRSDGNLSSQNDLNGMVPSPFRAPASSSSHSRPTSFIQPHSHFGSQQSLNQALTSPSGTPWRGPFQGAAANGSRNSSRGSAPGSPGPDADRERRSFTMDRGERSRTPVQVDHR